METRNTTILAIDDNPDNLASLEAITREVIPGARVLTSLSGPEGLARARLEGPDIVLLDIVMPGMDGFEVCREFKNDEQLRHIPIVFLTALQTRRELRIAALEAGADGFLSKPIDEVELHAQIKAMLQIRSYLIFQQRENEKLNQLVAARTEDLQKELKEHQVAEARLRESEARFRTMLEYSPIAYQALDEEGRYLDVNDEYCSLLGYDRAELLGKPCVNFWSPEERPFFESRFAEFLNQNTLHGEMRLLRRTGETVDMQVEGRVQRDSRGKFIRTHCVLFNITQRKEMERVLRASEAMYRSLFHEHSAIKMLIDPETGRILDTNEAAAKFYGWSREELTNMSIQQINILSETEVRLSLQQVVQQDGSHLEFRHRLADGSIREVLVNAGPVEIDGKKLVHSIVQDVSEQKEFNRELVNARQRAEESDRLKSTFLANMSHEVRTPMNAIIGFSDLLTDPDLTSSDQQQYAEIIRQRSYDLLGIINDILNISLIDTGELKIIEEEGNIEEILQTLHLSFSQLVKTEKAQRVQLFCKVELPTSSKQVLVDSGRLRQVLTNLLSNALKFTDEGSITFGCLQKKQDEITFYVSDTGIGIPREAQEFIFNRFRQVDESTTRNYGGTGLGLSICKGLIELMGGRITVDSEPGVGSTFRFTLPCRPVSAAHANTDEDTSTK